MDSEEVELRVLVRVARRHLGFTNQLTEEEERNLVALIARVISIKYGHNMEVSPAAPSNNEKKVEGEKPFESENKGARPG